MEVNKIRNLNLQELQEQEREAAEQLFRLKFQMKMGQTGGLKKLRELRKDLARIKTISRERQLEQNGNTAIGAQEPAPARAAKAVAKESGSANTAQKRTASRKAATEKK